MEGEELHREFEELLNNLQKVKELYTNADKRSPFSPDDKKQIDKALKQANGKKKAYHSYLTRKDKAGGKKGGSDQQLMEIENGMRKFIVTKTNEPKMGNIFRKAKIKVKLNIPIIRYIMIAFLNGPHRMCITYPRLKHKLPRLSARSYNFSYFHPAIAKYMNCHHRNHRIHRNPNRSRESIFFCRLPVYHYQYSRPIPYRGRNQLIYN